MVPLPRNVRRALCTGCPISLNVQSALCTVKAASQTYRQPSARLRFARAPISIHILDPWSPDAPHGKFWYRFRQSQIQGRPDAPTGKFREDFQSFRLHANWQFLDKKDDTNERYSVWNQYRRKPRNVYGIAFVGIIYSVWHRFCCV